MFFKFCYILFSESRKQERMADCHDQPVHQLSKWAGRRRSDWKRGIGQETAESSKSLVSILWVSAILTVLRAWIENGIKWFLYHNIKGILDEQLWVIGNLWLQHKGMPFWIITRTIIYSWLTLLSNEIEIFEIIHNICPLKKITLILRGWHGILTRATDLEWKYLNHYTNGECVASIMNLIIHKLHRSHRA